MANGDTAAALGWTTFASSQSRSQGYDDINYSLDRAADQANRLTVVEAAVNQPIFMAQRSTASFTIGYRTWTSLGSNAWATPRLNTGFSSWNNGQLTITQPGVYRVGASVHFETATYTSVGVQVTKNTASADTANTLASAENGGVGASFSKPAPLVAGDVIQVLVYQWDASSAVGHAVRSNAFDLTFDLEWLRS